MLPETSSLFVAVFLDYTSTGRVGLWFCGSMSSSTDNGSGLRRRGNGLKSHPTDSEKPGIEPATPGLQDIGLPPNPRWRF